MIFNDSLPCCLGEPPGVEPRLLLPEREGGGGAGVHAGELRAHRGRGPARPRPRHLQPLRQPEEDGGGGDGAHHARHAQHHQVGGKHLS